MQAEPELRQFAPVEFREPAKIVFATFDRLQSLIVSQKASWLSKVGTVIIDEVAQTSASSIFGLASKLPDGCQYICCGDPRQIGETLRCRDIARSPFSFTVFHFWKQAIFLDACRRCPPSVVSLVSELSYNGKLKSEWSNKDESVSKRLQQSFGPMATSGLGIFEYDSNVPVSRKDGRSLSNHTEIAVAIDLIKKLIPNWESRLDPEDQALASAIMLVSIYKGQVEAIKKRIHSQMPHVSAHIKKIGTAASLQGSESKIVIFLGTRESYLDDTEEAWIYSEQQLNVAFSRAQCALMCIWNSSWRRSKLPVMRLIDNFFCKNTKGRVIGRWNWVNSELPPDRRAEIVARRIANEEDSLETGTSVLIDILREMHDAADIRYLVSDCISKVFRVGKMGRHYVSSIYILHILAHLSRAPPRICEEIQHCAEDFLSDWLGSFFIAMTVWEDSIAIRASQINLVKRLLCLIPSCILDATALQSLIQKISLFEQTKMITSFFSAEESGEYVLWNSRKIVTNTQDQ
jgi:hypothetical protein